MNNLKRSNHKLTLASVVLTLGCTLSACGNGDNILAMGGAGSGGSGTTAPSTAPSTAGTETPINLNQLYGLDGYMLTANAYAPPCITEVCLMNIALLPAYLKYSFRWGGFDTNEFMLLDNRWDTITLERTSGTEYLIQDNWKPSGEFIFLSRNADNTAILSGYYTGNDTITDQAGMPYTISATRTDLFNQPVSEPLVPTSYFYKNNSTIKNFPTGSELYKIKLLSKLPKYEIFTNVNFGTFSTWNSFTQSYNSSTQGLFVTTSSSNLYLTFEPLSGVNASSSGIVHVKDSNGIAQSDGTYNEQDVNGQQLLLVSIPTQTGTFNQLYAVKNGVIYSGTFFPVGTEYDLNLLNRTAMNAIGYPAVPN